MQPRSRCLRRREITHADSADRRLLKARLFWNAFGMAAVGFDLSVVYRPTGCGWWELRLAAFVGP